MERVMTEALPAVAATINGMALRIADMAEFKPRVLLRLFYWTGSGNAY